MKIDRHNYEAYLLDLLEGTLSVEDEQELHNFLKLNPDCAGGLEEIAPWVLEKEEISFQHSQFLKKEFPGPSSQLNEYNFDLFSIARMEGDLSDRQLAEHRSMVASDDFKAQQWWEWQRTRLGTAEVVFHGKDQLKRKNGPRNKVLWISMLAAAAAVALVIVLLVSGPDISRQELSVETSPETLPAQNLEVTDQPEVQVIKEETEEEAAMHLPAARTIQKPTQEAKEVKATHNAMFSITRDPRRPPELGANSAESSREDLLPRASNISAQHMKFSYLPGEPVPDQIKALDVPPVSIHLGSLSLAQIYDMDLQDLLEDYTQERDVSLWTIANAGFKGINKIAGSDISLLASRDEEGEVTGFQLKSKRFSVTRPLGQAE